MSMNEGESLFVVAKDNYDVRGLARAEPAL